jgi:hypothetical protein
MSLCSPFGSELALRPTLINVTGVMLCLNFKIVSALQSRLN